MKNYSRNEIIIAYYFKAKHCIDDAQYLFKNKRIDSYGILMLQGLELLLKSFLLIEDKSITLNYLKKEFGHDYHKLYRACLRMKDADLISSSETKYSIGFLNSFYEDDYVKLRYQSGPKIRIHPRYIFKFLNEGLVNPIAELINKNYQAELKNNKAI